MDSELDEGALRRSYMILKLFMESGDIDSGITDRVHAWLLSDCHAREKEAALEMLFDEVVDGGDAEESLTKLKTAITEE